MRAELNLAESPEFKQGHWTKSFRKQETIGAKIVHSSRFPSYYVYLC